MFRFLPWKFIVKRAARAYGLADPALWLARIRSFAQPSEVAEPIELLRAGVLFHARGIVNTKAIQHNLDWVWPYWVQRQFDPEDVSFIPRAFSFSHVNLTHRNWTAIGLPQLSIYPIVDPRGLVTPLQDGWSIDFWVRDASGKTLVPSRMHDENVRQRLCFEEELVVETSCWLPGAEFGAEVLSGARGSSSAQRGAASARPGGRASEWLGHIGGAFADGGLAEALPSLVSRASVVLDGGEPAVQVDLEASSPRGGSLVVSIRPYNPEGVQFIDHIAARDAGDGFCVNHRLEVVCDRPADQLLFSDYAHGDVFTLLDDPTIRVSEDGSRPQVHCRVGMATAAAVYHFEGEGTRLRVRVPLKKELASLGNVGEFNPRTTWGAVRGKVARLGIGSQFSLTPALSHRERENALTVAALRVSDERIQFLYDAAIHTLVLLSADEIVPGPYTYRRFWFRDACLMMNALLSIGLADRCRRAIERFPSRQQLNGYFRSQEGEWDSNGQVLWILDRYETLTGEALGDEVLKAVEKAVAWIDRKRVRDKSDPLHNGLLPAGFSAEHFGPNDHYYWDDFWAEAGLRAAGRVFERRGRNTEAVDACAKADSLRGDIERSVGRIPAWRSLGGIPASPYRRIDSGAIGSLVADYPLQLYPPGAPEIMATVDALMRRSFVHGGFFQDMIHSGINAYLTLDIAQTLLRAGDARHRELVETVARLASPTGQWPEAIHPRTGGGCMGDGQHGWAAAEWVMMVRNMFVREEEDSLIVGSGLFSEWFEADHELRFGPTLTPWGPVTIRVERPASEPTVRVDAHWHRELPKILIQIPGFRKVMNMNASRGATLERCEGAADRAPATAFGEALSS
jgi:hypothetical protein